MTSSYAYIHSDPTPGGIHYALDVPRVIISLGPTIFYEKYDLCNVRLPKGGASLDHSIVVVVLFIKELY